MPAGRCWRGGIVGFGRAVRRTYPPVAFGVLRDLPKWEGGWSVDGCDVFPVNVWFEEGLGFSPLGDIIPEA